MGATAPSATVRAPLPATPLRAIRGDELESDLVDEHGTTLSAADKPLRTT